VSHVASVTTHKSQEWCQPSSASASACRHHLNRSLSAKPICRQGQRSPRRPRLSLVSQIAMSFSNTDRFLERSMALFTISEVSSCTANDKRLPSRNSLSRTSNERDLASLAGPFTSPVQELPSRQNSASQSLVESEGCDWGFYDDEDSNS
jgi:hypothetical protein